MEHGSLVYVQVQGSGSRVQGSGFRVQGSGFRVQDSGFRVQGSGFVIEVKDGTLSLMRLKASRAPVEEVLDIMSLIFVETCTGIPRS